eukprot:2481558-Rhodomonas_salina.1
MDRDREGAARKRARRRKKPTSREREKTNRRRKAGLRKQAARQRSIDRRAVRSLRGFSSSNTRGRKRHSATDKTTHAPHPGHLAP